ncbi:MAG: hypothetical protein ABI960_00700 [Candidatus Eisenbacteria bacterium]
MPNTTQSFNINAQGDATPSGNGARMSRTGANNLPNQAQWHTATKAVGIKLPSNVWNVTANDGNDYSFTLAANSASATYSLLVTAPTGTQSYTITTAPGVTGGNTSPSVVVEP